MTDPLLQPPAAQPSGARAYPDIAMSRALARVTDDLVRVPGTDLGIGLDALIGLVPGIGDALGAGLSGVIMVDAVRQRVPLTVLARMGWNLLVDTGLGFIPVAGDIADVAHRANRKNYRLLLECVENDRHVDTDARGYLIRAVALVAVVLLVAIALVVLLVWGVVAGLGSLVNRP